MKLSKIFAAGMALSMACLPMMADKKELNEKFMRSSIYSILVNSDDQNTRLDKEASSVDPEGYQEALTAAGLTSLGAVPMMVFPGIAIPEQFNDHNLEPRILVFDAIRPNITDEEAAAARPKGGGAGKFMKAMAADAVASASGNSESSMLRVEPLDDYMHAAVLKFFEANKTAPMMVAKWYNYDEARSPKFNHNFIGERGFDNASAAEIAQANVNDNIKDQLKAQGFDMINNTFVVATNLRFRNNKAVAKEISDMAGGAIGAAAGAAGGGALGGLAAMGAKKAAEAAANALMKDAYSVTAVTNLYKLVWNDDIDTQLSDKVLYNENATIDDLINSGLCKLEYVGQTKARSGVKKDKEKTFAQLAASATERAMDKAFAKLQVENEVFRTVVPVSSSADGFIYAKIGTKEGVAEGDEYEILEKQFDPKTERNSYKKVGSAKVEKGGVWFNTTGAEELIANADEKEAAKMKEAHDLGATKFKGGKKDYTGYFLRLAKKKGKIQD